MEVVPAQRPAFQRSDVQEWSRLDQLTGVLERGRMQTDHWASGSRRYDKAVDSRVRSLAGSNVQQRQHKQLEVFQAQGPKGSLQVVRSSLTTSSSSSGTVWRPSTDFENLQLPLNPLDSSPQKTRASVGRSGSIGARRPPTRLRQLTEKLDREELEIEVPTPTITPDEGSEARQKSSSTEDLEKVDDDEDAIWRRSAKIRRSLQFSSKAPALRTDSALKGLEALENVFRRGANIADSVNKTLAEGSDASGELDADSLANHLLSTQGDASKKNSKRHSFVTVESLKEVRDRLRPLNGFGKNSDDDDGIVTEDVEPPVSRVKSYVYGMEALAKKPIPATGSLESRSSNGRSEEWYNRRKSYGFEQMQGQEVSFRAKGRVESSTDSGICRSNETVTVAPPARKTVVTLGSDVSTNGYHHDTLSDPRRSSEPVTITIPITSDDKPKNVVEEKCLFYRQISEGTSVSIENSVNGEKRVPIKDNGFKQILNSTDKRGTWNIGESWKEPEPGLKRHSIAVDDTRFVKEESPSLSAVELAKKFDSLHMGRKDTVTTGINIAFVQSEEKRHKKVEFCKTEVHFVADSGRVNIVETDEKPPPTTMFRRRRRPTGVVGMSVSSGESGGGSLPETRFGDSPYEKQLLAGADDVEKDKDDGVLAQVGTALEPKSILKNYHKPRPFHLGDDAWGVKLRPVNSPSVTPNGDSVVWKSSVSVRSTTFDTPQEAGTTELQKLLRSLRPANKKSDGSESIDEGGSVQVKVGGISPADVRRPWSVADRVRQVEEMKGFSTKVNFGAGEATVVAAEEPASPRSIWLAKETPVSDEKKMTNGKEGLVVRIGERERNEKEEIAKKTTTITIDLKAEKGGRSLQAPGLIMRVAAPSQLAALKQLYSASDDSADEEVRSYMGGDNSDGDHDRASEVSGSWSRVRALRNVAAYRTGTMTTSLKTEDSHVSAASASIPSFDQNKLINTRSARPKITSISLRYEGEPDSPKVNNTNQRRYTAPSSSDLFQSFAAKSTNLGAKASTSPLHREYENCTLVNNGVDHEPQTRSSPVKYSHIKENGVSSYDDHFSLPEREAVEVATKKQSTEILFQSSKQPKTAEEPSYVNVDLGGEAQAKLSQVSSRFSRETTSSKKNTSPQKSPTRDTYKIHTGTYIKENATNKYNWKLGSERKETESLVSSVPNEGVPSRQALSNEFSSSKVAQKSWKEVQRVNNSSVTTESRRGNAVNSRTKRVESKEVANGPVYENTEIISQEIKKSTRQRNKVENQEHDSAIMEELTRAADEILRAVNGYTDDESNRASSEDDDHDAVRRNKRSKAKVPPSRRLGTIAEAPGNRAPRRETVASSAKRKQPTSSTSSVESVRAVSSRTARLLQRASSREKLLQRRASSSEDADADPRKNRVSSRPQHRKPTEATRLKERIVNKRVVPQHRIQHERSGRTASVKKESQDLKTISSRRTVDKVPGNNLNTARDRRERQSAVPSCATKKISSSSRSEGNLQAKVPNKV